MGRAGQLLDRMIAAMGLAPATDVYVCNIVKCRPPGNRRPEPEEVAGLFDALVAAVGLRELAVPLKAGIKAAGANPQLASAGGNPELASNGGPTQTLALTLLSGSPAIGGGVPAFYPGSSTDIATDLDKSISAIAGREQLVNAVKAEVENVHQISARSKADLTLRSRKARKRIHH